MGRSLLWDQRWENRNRQLCHMQRFLFARHSNRLPSPEACGVQGAERSRSLFKPTQKPLGPTFCRAGHCIHLYSLSKQRATESQDYLIQVPPAWHRGQRGRSVKYVLRTGWPEGCRVQRWTQMGTQMSVLCFPKVRSCLEHKLCETR